MRHQLLSVFFFIVTFGLLSDATAQVSGVVIKANDPNVDYVARAEFHPDGSVSFDWSGSHIRTSFTGSSISIRLSDTNNNYYDVFIDDKYNRTVRSNSADTTILLADNLMAKDCHKLLLYKRTEGFEGITTVHSFIIEDGTKLLSVERPTRKILFIGDSLTAGFATESDNPRAPYSGKISNSYHAFASIAARYFDADYHLIAHSGEGVVKNYDDETQTSKYTMKDRIYNLYDTKSDVKWDFKKWQPDLIVINLGTNDFSKTHVHPTDAQFIAGYLQIFKTLREQYGDVPILNMSKRKDKVNELIDQAVKESKDKNIYFINIPAPLLFTEKEDTGAGHPNYKGQRKMAMTLIPYVSSLMSWPLEAKIIE